MGKESINPPVVISPDLSGLTPPKNEGNQLIVRNREETLSESQRFMTELGITSFFQKLIDQKTVISRQEKRDKQFLGISYKTKEIIPARINFSSDSVKISLLYDDIQQRDCSGNLDSWEASKTVFVEKGQYSIIIGSVVDHQVVYEAPIFTGADIPKMVIDAIHITKK